MSKRHRKSKHLISVFDDDYDDLLYSHYADTDYGRGKKSCTKNKRQSVKRAYYD